MSLRTLPALRLSAATIVMAGSLLLAADASANANPTAPQKPSCDGEHHGAVIINGGTVTNNTSIGLGANGGTGISDASGGDQNLAAPEGSAGNGGVADSGASGGAIGAGDVNSGGDAGNAIAVGDTIGDGSGCAPAVQITGGTVTNNTSIGISANGGTAIADASGGDNNIAVGGHAGNGGVSSVSSAGNGGVANAQSNGGAISLGNINSGGNVGNAISVGNTQQSPGKPVCCTPTKPGKPGAPAPGKPGIKTVSTPGKGGKVAKLPATGSGLVADETALQAALLAVAALGSLGLAGGAARRRLR
ncbi:MAG TPA: hypothetical protein VFU81_03665 [Thermomicrobiales bacterium]|nr:hypothetical protein [Thermomicrobiales bacterium]